MQAAMCAAQSLSVFMQRLSQDLPASDFFYLTLCWRGPSNDV